MHYDPTARAALKLERDPADAWGDLRAAELLAALLDLARKDADKGDLAAGDFLRSLAEAARGAGGRWGVLAR